MEPPCSLHFAGTCEQVLVCGDQLLCHYQVTVMTAYLGT